MLGQSQGISGRSKADYDDPRKQVLPRSSPNLQNLQLAMIPGSVSFPHSLLHGREGKCR